MTNSDLKDGGYIMINGWPCKIVEMSISKTRKHGHTKVHFVDLDIFMGKNYEDISPSTHVSDVAAVQREEYQLVRFDSLMGVCVLMGFFRMELMMMTSSFY